MIVLFLIVRRTPTIRELIVATPVTLSSPSATGVSAHAPAQRLERSDFVHRCIADVADHGLGRLNWADSAPTEIASGATAVRAKAVILPCQSRHSIASAK